MTCHHGFVRSKGQATRQSQRQTRKPAAQTSSKETGAISNDERRGYSPTTVFPEFANPADIASIQKE
jgi:hypothetical protein